MKQIKRLIRLLALVMVLSVLSPSMIPLNTTSVAQAATVKLNKKTLTLEVGKSTTLKITGTKSKITWSSSNKAVATVNTKGKVTAKKAGKATITATVNKKKYSCTVTVKKAVDPYIKNAPFSAQEATLGKIKFVYPKDFTNQVITGEGSQLMTLLYPKNADSLSGTPYLTIYIEETDGSKPDSCEVQKFIENNYNQKMIEEQFGVTLGTSISNLNISELQATLGTAYKVEFDLVLTEPVSITMPQSIYVLFLDQNLFILSISDIGDGDQRKLTEIAEYMINSLRIIK